LAISKSPEEAFKKRLKVFKSDKEIKEITTFNNATLGNMALTTSPFTEKLLLKFDDIEYLISKIQPISFRVKGSLRLQFDKTLELLEHKLVPQFERISSDFSTLIEQEKKAIIFAFLSLILPKILLRVTT